MRSDKISIEILTTHGIDQERRHLDMATTTTNDAEAPGSPDDHPSDPDELVVFGRGDSRVKILKASSGLTRSDAFDLSWCRIEGNLFSREDGNPAPILLRHTPDGTPVCNVRMGAKVRKPVPETEGKEWEDFLLRWIDLTFWGEKAEEFAAEFEDGDWVQIWFPGENVEVQKWEDKKTGDPRQKTVVTVQSYAHHQRGPKKALNKRLKHGGGGGSSRSDEDVAEQQDPTAER